MRGERERGEGEGRREERGYKKERVQTTHTPNAKGWVRGDRGKFGEAEKTIVTSPHQLSTAKEEDWLN